MPETCFGMNVHQVSEYVNKTDHGDKLIMQCLTIIISVKKKVFSSKTHCIMSGS